MLARLLRSKLFGFFVAVVGAFMLVAGGARWVRPVPGPPDGASLDNFNRVVTLPVSVGSSPARSGPIVVRGDTMHRVVVNGSLDFAKTGETLDGDLLVTSSDDRLPRLVLGSGEASLVGVASPGRWVFTLPDEIRSGGQLEVRIETASMTDPLQLSAQEILDSLSGELSVELWSRTAPLRGPIAAAPFWFPGGFLLAFGIALSVLSGRVRKLESSPALVLLGKIDHESATLRKLIDPSELGSASLLSGVDRAEKEARSLAQSIDRRTALLLGLSSETAPEEAAAVQTAIADAGSALQAIGAGIVSAQAKARAGEVTAAAKDLETTIARSLAARAQLGRQVGELREVVSATEAPPGPPSERDAEGG